MTLRDRLVANSAGTYQTEAAAYILTRAIGGTLPTRLEAAIDDDRVAGSAWIDWKLALEISQAFSGGERRIIALAASLAGECSINARDVLTGLDQPNGRIVLAALAHCLQVRL